MREDRLYTQPGWLFKRYWGENLSAKKMGTLCGVEACTIKKYMRKNNIAFRTVSEAYQVGYGISKYRDKKWLYREYWIKGGTLRSIAKLCGRDKKTISDWMDEFNIPRRSRSEWQKRVIKATRKRYHHSLYGRFIAKVKTIIKSIDDYMMVKDN